MLVLLSRFLLAILENWRQKIKIDDFFGSNIFGARAIPGSLCKVVVFCH
jgi:hypothetical protein